MIKGLARCLGKAVSARVLDDEAADALLELARKKASAYARTMSETDAEQAAVKAVLDEHEAARRLAKRQRNLEIIRAQSIHEAMASHGKGAYQSALSHLTHDVSGQHKGGNVEARTDSIAKTAFRMMRETIEAYRHKAFGLKQDKAGMRAFIRELFGESTGDKTAAAAAKGWSEAAEYLRVRHGRAGGAIGFREDWHLPQTHNAERIRKAGYDEWVSSFGEKSRAKMMEEHGLTPEELNASLQQVYKTLETDGMSRLRVSETGGVAGRGSKLANRRADPRFLLFATADEWLAYNEKFGAGNIFDVLTHHVRNMSRETALMEILGPNPAAMIRGMQATIKQDGTRKSLRQAGRLGKVYDVVSDRVKTPEHDLVARTFGGARNLMTSAQLGSALLSSVSDFVFTKSAAHWNGLSATRMMGRYLALMNPADESHRSVARRLGLIMDAYFGKSAAARRYGDDVIGDGFTGWVADSALRLSGLTAHTDHLKNAFRLEMLGTLADEAGKTWDVLPAQLRQGLERGGIDAAGWEAVRPFALLDAKGSKFMDPVSMMTMGDALQAKAGQALHDLILSEASFAVPEPNADVRSFTAGQRGTFGGELTRSFFQYKTFGMSVIMLNMVRTWHQAGGGLKGSAAVAWEIGLLTGLGALALQLRQISSGKDPRDMGDSAFWGESFIQGGGFGIYGDFLRSALDRNSQDLMKPIMEPTGGLVNDRARLSSTQARRYFDDTDTKFGAELVSFVHRYMPGSSLWYLKLAMDRLVFSQLRMAADPRAARTYRNMEKKVRNDYGQKFFWRPGKTAPERLADIGAAFGGS